MQGLTVVSLLRPPRVAHWKPRPRDRPDCPFWVAWRARFCGYGMAAVSPIAAEKVHGSPVMGRKEFHAAGRQAPSVVE